MKKILILLLVILVAGCAKKLPPPQGSEMQTGKSAKETSAESVKKETVKEVVEPKVAKLEETSTSSRAEESVVLQDALFDYDRYDIRADARPVLDSAASFLKKNTNLNVLIEGHCDERGTNEYNLALGEKRAKAVKDYLASLGINPARMTVMTYGEEKPVCTEHDENCWQKNRRAHFVVTGK
jgi:peptidoglycan-associated lipoprotein